MDLTNTKNIIFDLGGVLLNLDFNRTRQAFINLGLKDFDRIYTFRRQDTLFDDLETGRISVDEFYDTVREYVPQATNKNIADAWNAMLLDLPRHRVDMLKRLGNKYRLFLLSNTNAIHIDAFRKIVSDAYDPELFDRLFEAHYYSSEIGYRKPNRDCFEFILNENGLVAGETLFIDDGPHHVEGAIAAGLKGHHLPNEIDVTTLFD